MHLHVQLSVISFIVLLQVHVPVRVHDCMSVCSPASLIRCDEDTHQHELLLEQSDSLHAVLDSLNSLGSFPWTINKRVSTQ